MSWTDLKELVTETYRCWSDHNAPRLGASLAYYSLLSIAPLMILVVAICGLVFRQSAEQAVLAQTQEYIGSGGASALKMLLDNAHRPRAGIVASIIAVVTLLFGASGVFTELQSSLNAIWDAKPKVSGGVWSLIRQRIGSFLMVLALGALLLLSLLLSATLAIVEKFATNYVPLPPVAGELINLLVSLAVLIVFFALVFKFVPEVPIRWYDVWIGAAVTAVLFVIGKALLAIYFSKAAVGSTYGAAGSLVAFVIWVYYSAQIFFFGAMFTRIFAQRFGSHQRRAKVLSARAQTA